MTPYNTRNYQLPYPDSSDTIEPYSISIKFSFYPTAKQHDIGIAIPSFRPSACLCLSYSSNVSSLFKLSEFCAISPFLYEYQTEWAYSTTPTKRSGVTVLHALHGAI